MPLYLLYTAMQKVKNGQKLKSRGPAIFGHPAQKACTLRSTKKKLVDMVVPVKIRSEVKSKMLMAVCDFYRLVLDVDSFMYRRNIL